jgi:hypothetical protein
MNEKILGDGVYLTAQSDGISEMEIREISGQTIPVYLNEFWTAQQRACHSIHEISYRACYKPQLPAFFIERFCKSGDIVYDPFMGRGTTLIEAQLHGCRAIGNDINPLSHVLAGPRLDPPSLSSIEARLSEITLAWEQVEDSELLTFFHPNTLGELYSWKQWFSLRKAEGSFDIVDAWIQMVACNRLTGHSPGFFSVYTLPPNQAASVASQRKINARKKQEPPYRDTKVLILRKSRQLLRHCVPEGYGSSKAQLLTRSADNTPEIMADSVDLVVTSPPFVDTVDYLGDNWLRMWFCGIESSLKELWQIRSLDQWVQRMKATLCELGRVVRPNGRIAFEVGEVRKGSLLLENEVVSAALEVGLACECIVINAQMFTKTANCWGVSNNAKGTNSNRIVILYKPQ